MHPAALSSVLGRIGQIESAFAPPETTAGATVPAPNAENVDLFGEAYQAAVAATRLATRTTTATATATPVHLGAELGTAFAPMLRTPTALPGAATPDDRIVAAIIGRLVPPGPQRVGGYGSMSVPPELAGFGNGRVPSSALVALGSQPVHRLHRPAAASWDGVVAAAAADGIDLRITDSYRSYAEQVDLAERKGLYSDGGLAATPGRSNHGWGLAVDADVTDRRVLDWLRTNGPRFGWVEAVSREPWHWEFRPDQVGMP